MKPLTDIFQLLEEFSEKLRKAVSDQRINFRGNFEQSVNQLALDIQLATLDYQNLVVGAVHISHESSTGITHQINTSVICELLARSNGWPEQDRRALIAAALTHDMSMIYLKGLLESHQGQLSEYQRDKIQAHPAEGSQWLRGAGIANPIWLAAVEQHHERMDGGGYPAGLKADQISTGAKILAVADVYCAMIKPRSYREQLQTPEALKDMLLKQGGELDVTQIQRLIKVIGLYPPGVLVRLQGGKLAIVLKPGLEAHLPKVMVVADGSGRAASVPHIEDCTQQGKLIEAVVPFLPEHAAQIDLASIWNNLQDQY